MKLWNYENKEKIIKLEKRFTLLKINSILNIIYKFC